MLFNDKISTLIGEDGYNDYAVSKEEPNREFEVPETYISRTETIPTSKVKAPEETASKFIDIAVPFDTVARRTNLGGASKGGVLQSASKGVAIGTSAGSIIPVFGNTVGGIIGGAIGAVTSFIGKDDRPRLSQHIEQLLDVAFSESGVNHSKGITERGRTYENALRINPKLSKSQAVQYVRNIISELANTQTGDNRELLTSALNQMYVGSPSGYDTGEYLLLVRFEKLEAVKPKQATVTNGTKSELSKVAKPVGALAILAYLIG